LRPVDNVTQLPLDKITLGNAMKAAGYATGYFGKWHLGQNGEYHPGKRGFDEALTSMGQHFNFVTQPPVKYAPGTYLADFLCDKTVDFIRNHKDQPFYVELAHFAVHAPHEAKANLIAKFKPKPGVGGHKDPVYAAMIASVDESVGRVLAVLDELHLSENTLVIFSSDNGGVGGYLREGIKKGNDITDNAPLRSGKGSLYEGGVRVPYVFRWPGHIPTGTVSDTPINSVDLYPTLLEVAGAKPKTGYTLDGVSYLKLLTSGGTGDLGREALYWHFPGYLGAGKGQWRTTPGGSIRRGDWKLIEYFEDMHVELYNLKDDIGEKNNLAKAKPELAKDLTEKLHTWRTSVGAKIPTANKR
jgi:arylsulfatase A-like enzyme